MRPVLGARILCCVQSNTCFDEHENLRGFIIVDPLNVPCVSELEPHPLIELPIATKREYLPRPQLMANRRGRLALRTPSSSTSIVPAAPADWLRARTSHWEPLFDMRASPCPSVMSSTCFASTSDLAGRTHELPPPLARGAAAVVADGPAAAASSAAALVSLGFGPVVVVTLDDVRMHAPDLLPEVAACDTVGPGFDSDIAFRSHALWSPSPSVVELLPRLGVTARPRRALDVGCGSGRDAAYLAAHGWDVLAVDRDRGLVEKAEALGARRWDGLGASTDVCPGAVVGAVRTLGADLRADACWLRENAADLLVVVRFLRRGVLELLPQAVVDGGWVIVEHFLTGCENLGGPVKRSQMLERGELGRLFGPAGFTILIEEEVFLDDGRPVVRFLAVRKSSAT